MTYLDSAAPRFVFTPVTRPFFIMISSTGVDVTKRTPISLAACSYDLATQRGVIQPSDGHQRTALTCAKSIGGQRRFASSLSISSASRPASSVARFNSRNSAARGSLSAMRSEPTSCQSGFSAVCCSSRKTDTECIASRMRSAESRTCPQRPAPCAVVTCPTSSARSSSRVSVLPALASA